MTQMEQERQEMIEALVEVFVALDTSGDGRVSHEELSNMLEDETNAKKVAQMCNTTIRDMMEVLRALEPPDGSGVTLTEFVGRLIDSGKSVTEKSIMKLENRLANLEDFLIKEFESIREVAAIKEAGMARRARSNDALSPRFPLVEHSGAKLDSPGYADELLDSRIMLFEEVLKGQFASLKDAYQTSKECRDRGQRAARQQAEYGKQDDFSGREADKIGSIADRFLAERANRSEELRKACNSSLSDSLSKLEELSEKACKNRQNLKQLRGDAPSPAPGTATTIRISPSPGSAHASAALLGDVLTPRSNQPLLGERGVTVGDGRGPSLPERPRTESTASKQVRMDDYYTSRDVYAPRPDRGP